MINIKISINNAPKGMDINSVAHEISALLEQFTGQNVQTNVNLKDDNSMSPLGLYQTKEYLRLSQFKGA